MNPSRLVRGTVLLTISNLIFTASGYVVQVLVGRFYSPAVYGIFGVVISFANTATVFALSGFSRTVMREVALRPRSARYIVRASLLFQMPIAMAAALLLILWARPIAILMNNEAMTPYLQIAALIFPVYSIRTIYQSLLNGTHRYRDQARSSNIASVVKIALPIIVLVLGADARYIVASYVVSAFVAYVSSAIAARSIQGDEPVNRRQLFLRSMSLTVQAFGLPLIFSLDILIARAILTDDAMIGYYAAASTLARFLFILPVGLRLGLFPHIASLTTQQDTTRIRNATRAAMRYSILLLAPLAVIGAVTARPLLSLFYSATYAPATASLQLLLFGISFLTITSVLETVVLAVSHDAAAQRATWFLVALCLVANVVFIPKFGILGAALATTLTGAAGLLAFGVPLARRMGSFFTGRSFVNAMIASAVAGAVAWEAVRLFHLHGIVLLITEVAFLALYAAALWLLKEIRREDVGVLRAILRRDTAAQEPTSPDRA